MNKGKTERKRGRKKQRKKETKKRRNKETKKQRNKERNKERNKQTNATPNTNYQVQMEIDMPTQKTTKLRELTNAPTLSVRSAGTSELLTKNSSNAGLEEICTGIKDGMTVRQADSNNNHHVSLLD